MSELTELLERFTMDRKCDRDTLFMRWRVLIEQRLGILKYHADRMYEQMVAEGHDV